MQREIMKNPMFLQMKSEPADRNDLAAAQDLLDTIQAHSHECVGMAANMIGIRKNIIVIQYGIGHLVMFNPKITKSSGPYETEEGCLSLIGTRHAKRFQKITVKYQNMDFKEHTMEFSGYTAQIIQHEIDHLKGILI